MTKRFQERMGKTVKLCDGAQDRGVKPGKNLLFQAWLLHVSTTNLSKHLNLTEP